MKHERLIVAVHLVTHNSATTIGVCLSALRKQTFRDLKICVIDNNSTDETVKLVRKYNPDILILNAKNVGYAAGHNQALGLTQSKYVLTLNPDVLLDARFIEQMVNTLETSQERIGSAAGLLFRVNNLHEEPQFIDGAGLYMQVNRRQLLRLEGREVAKHELHNELIFGPDGAAAFYRREMLNDIDLGDGVFDESFFMHKEDVDVCWRAQLRGWSSMFVSLAHARHIRTFRAGKRQQIGNTMRRMAVRNRYYLMIKNELGLLFLRDLFFIVIYDVGIFMYVLLKEQSSLSAYTQVTQSLPRLLLKRSRIQITKIVSVYDMAHWFRWRMM